MPCPVCGGTRFQEEYWRSLESPYLLRWGEKVPDARAGIEGRIIQRCLGCGFVSVNPLPSEEELARYYDKDFYTSGLRQNTILRWGGYAQPYDTEEGRRRTLAANQSLLSKWCEVWRDGGATVDLPRYLDIGCGTGLLVDAGRALGWFSRGVEISDYGYAFAHHRLGLDVFHGPLGAADFPDDAFDIVSIIGVLEHVRRPNELLIESERILRPGGLIVVEVPNDLHSFRNLLFRRKWWMVPPLHLNYFARDSLRNILDKASLREISVRSKGFGHNQVYNDTKLVALYELRRWIKPNRFAALANAEISRTSFTPATAIRRSRLRSLAISIDILLGRYFTVPDLVMARLDKQSELLAFARKPEGSHPRVERGD